MERKRDGETVRVIESDREKERRMESESDGEIERWRDSE